MPSRVWIFAPARSDGLPVLSTVSTPALTNSRMHATSSAAMDVAVEVPDWTSWPVSFDGLLPRLIRSKNAMSRFLVEKDQWGFFVSGRVFEMLVWESQGPHLKGSHKYEDYAKIYQYVVVRAKPKQGYSMCLRVSTYDHLGTVRKGLDQNAHAIMYTGKTPPRTLPEEKMLTKDPIQVVPVGGNELEARSLVNLAKAYPVEHKVEVLEVGRVTGGHLKRLLAYWESELERDFPAKKGFPAKRVGGNELEALSRVNLAKVYPVEHNVEVLEVGRVTGGHLEKLLAYSKSE